MARLQPDQAEFLEKLKTAAPAAEGRGVPAAVVLAQAIIESGWGRSGLARLGNALFGIKAGPLWGGACYSGTTKEWEGGVYVTYHGTNRVYSSRAEALAAGAHPVALFRAYQAVEESLLDHAEFFHRNRRYHPCLAAYAEEKDPRAFARCIAQAGYATSPTYAATLISVMEQFCPEFLAPAVLPVPTPAPWPGAPAPVPDAKPQVIVLGRPLPTEAVEFRDGKVWVKVRPALEAAGLRVVWNPAARTVEAGR